MFLSVFQYTEPEMIPTDNGTQFKAHIFKECNEMLRFTFDLQLLDIYKPMPSRKELVHPSNPLFML